ncbi:MAG: hypothetical protein E4H14_05510 [Candidatus Thorarchaeota archaeon]|nr:MAG: hypothetical protein E4H14_05510 [Candidatus Thorarchaeota archaeon]
MKLKEAYNYGRNVPMSSIPKSEDIEKISGYLESLRKKEGVNASLVASLFGDMITLHLREQWLKDDHTRHMWEDDYTAYAEHESKMMIDDFVDKFSVAVKKYLSSRSFTGHASPFQYR